MQMDPIEAFPAEISLEIYDYLNPEDLCRCLAVNHRWRNLANSEKHWKSFCKKRGLNMSPMEEQQTCEMLPLCQWAMIYINYMNKLVNNWRKCRFSSFQLPKEDWCCCIAGCERKAAVYYPRTCTVYLYHVSECIESIGNIKVTLPYSIAIPDVFINEQFLVVSKGNVVLIYKNNGRYNLYKIIVGHEFGLTIDNHIFPIAENDKRLYVKVISEKFIWMESDAVYVIDIYSNTYKVLNDTFRCLRLDGKHIYAANDSVTCYNLKGDKLFSLKINSVEDMWVKDETIVILKGASSQQHLEVWNLKFKSIVCTIAVQKDPCVSINYQARNLFVFELMDDRYVISCFSSQTGNVLWNYEHHCSREVSIHPEIRLVCERFLFVRPSHTCDTNFILLESKTGKILYDSIMPPCLLPPCYIYYLSDEFIITAESNTIHFRSYIV